MITSSQNSRIQMVRSLLGRSKERRQSGTLVVEGVRLLEEALAAGWKFRFALYSQALSERGWELLQRLSEAGVETDEVTEQLLTSTSDTKSPQGLLAVLELQALPIPKQTNFALILDEIRDPGNVGNLLRSAAAAGAQAVFLTPGSADAFAPKVVRAGMGAHFRLPIHTMDWQEIREQLQGLKFVLTEMDAPLACWQADLRQGLAIIIGGEAEGASAAARQMCDESIHIPMAAGTESLNAAAAGAVILFEVRRQRDA
jgi:TrmH family RNA methyltransferase